MSKERDDALAANIRDSLVQLNSAIWQARKEGLKVLALDLNSIGYNSDEEVLKEKISITRIL